MSLNPVLKFSTTGSIQCTEAEALSWHQGKPSACAMQYRQEAGWLYL